EIKVGGVLEAAGLIKETYPYFPERTVHVGVVDPGVGGRRRLIGVEANGHFFVGPDNGLFWPVIENDRQAKIIMLTRSKYFLESVTQTFHGREIFAPVAAHLSRGIALEKMGTAIDDPMPLSFPVPYEKDGFLYGQILHIDNFGNLISNISQDVLKDYLKSAEPVIEAGHLVIRGLSQIYADSDEGQALILINSSNRLEIAVNMGRASEYIGVDSGEIVGTVVKVGKS
ncbi:MAG: SAM-dependent chlorinase/fluorinase, partial [Deltaproteobacteria bacterium]|nr:SAM-dependent chlorinase/fluorinase [Deltaproteobacteria bacterium]